MGEEEEKSGGREHGSALNYMPPRDDTELVRKARSARIFAAVITLVAGFFFITTLIAVSLSGMGRPTGQIEAWAWPGSVALFVIALTAYEHFIVRRRGFLQGVMIGLGILALLLGTCFFVNR